MIACKQWVAGGCALGCLYNTKAQLLEYMSGLAQGLPPAAGVARVLLIM